MIFNFGMSRQEVYADGLRAVIAFLEVNQISIPVFTAGPPPRALNKWQSYGLYMSYRFLKGPSARRPEIFVNVARAAMPTRERSRIWSYPGHKTDRTPAGILAHETGHHVGHELRLDTSSEWFDIWLFSDSVTSYEPTMEEGFAETMRLFILNPELLRKGRPSRYQYLIDAGLKPLKPGGNWKVDVLANAPQHIKDAANKFANA